MILRTPRERFSPLADTARTARKGLCKLVPGQFCERCRTIDRPERPGSQSRKASACGQSSRVRMANWAARCRGAYAPPLRLPEDGSGTGGTGPALRLPEGGSGTGGTGPSRPAAQVDCRTRSVRSRVTAPSLLDPRLGSQQKEGQRRIFSLPGKAHPTP